MKTKQDSSRSLTPIANPSVSPLGTTFCVLPFIFCAYPQSSFCDPFCHYSHGPNDLFLTPITATAHSVVPLLLPLSCDYPAFSAARVELPKSSVGLDHSWASQMTLTRSKGRFPGSPVASLAAAPWVPCFFLLCFPFSKCSSMLSQSSDSSLF